MIATCRAFFQGVACLLLLTGLTACGIFKNNEDAQALVSQRLVGMPMGTFIDRFGLPGQRAEQLGGNIIYVWSSSTSALGAGAANVDQSICTLRLVADARGRIATVEVALNSPGRVSSSRCDEIFSAATKVAPK